MNQNELKYFSKDELAYPDVTSLSPILVLKSLLIKIRRKTWGRLIDKGSRFIWTVDAANDSTGPADNVRNYQERRTIRVILSGLCSGRLLKNACEVGCGYGRLTMVLKEFADRAVGFEREKHLVDIGKLLLPGIEFKNIDSLDRISAVDPGPFDFTMTCTVLQHLTDDHCRKVLEEIKRITPNGHVLLIEKTDDISTTVNTDNGNAFLSRARSPQVYAGWMEPYKLISVTKRVIEPTYFNPNPGSCMLFRSPDIK